MALNVKDILNKMVQAAKGNFGKHWPGVKDLVTWEFKRLAFNVVEIERMKSKRAITKKEARFQIELQKHTIKNTMKSKIALGFSIVEEAIKAAFKVISEKVYKAIGWNLL